MLGADHPDTIASVNNLANCLTAQGKTAEAEPMIRQALAAYTRVLGTDHPDTIMIVNNLAICLVVQGKSAVSEPMFRQALAAFTRVLGADHPSTISCVSGLAICLKAQGKSQQQCAVQCAGAMHPPLGVLPPCRRQTRHLITQQQTSHNVRKPLKTFPM